MIKTYRILLLLIGLIFLSTYNPYKINSILEKNDYFFKIKNIKIVNNFLIEESEIKNKLNKIRKKNILFLKKKDVEKPLKEIDFLKKIEVKKKYPDTIIVTIFETKPVAFIFKNKAKYILDSSSKLIPLDKDNNLYQLPNIIGEGAKNYFMSFYNELEGYNFPANEIKNFYYFQIGRWDLELVNNKLIKFPHNNIGTAIKKSIELLNREDFQNYNIIDLRVEGKIIVE